MSVEELQNMKEKELIIPNRTEEVRDIIERMPNTFAKYITYVAFGIVGLLIFFGYIVKYPDIVTGEVTISAQHAPLRLVSEQNGKLKINQLKSQDVVKVGQLIAWVDNPADPALVQKIKDHTQDLNLEGFKAGKFYSVLPKNMNIGDFTIPYTSFLTAVKQLADYQDHRLYDKQEQSLSNILQEQRQALGTLKEKENLSKENIKLNQKFLDRDSILLARKVLVKQNKNNLLLPISIQLINIKHPCVIQVQYESKSPTLKIRFNKIKLPKQSENFNWSWN